MELAHQMRLRRMLLRARWLPRLQNQEADDLTNEEFRHFDPKKRIPVKLEELGFKIMDSLFKVGDDYLLELERLRASEKRKATERQDKSRKSALAGSKKLKSLKETDPW